MNSVTQGVQQLSNWATGDLIIYGGAIGFVIVGFMCFAARMAIIGFIAVAVGVAIASGGVGMARAVYGFFHSAALERPADRAFAMLASPPSHSYTLAVQPDGTFAVEAA